MQRLSVDAHKEAVFAPVRGLPRDMRMAHCELGAVVDAAPENEQLVAVLASAPKRSFSVVNHLSRDGERGDGREAQAGTSFCVNPAIWGCS
jgi:hypothetical protein